MLSKNHKKMLNFLKYRAFFARGNKNEMRWRLGEPQPAGNEV